MRYNKNTYNCRFITSALLIILCLFMFVSDTYSQGNAIKISYAPIARTQVQGDIQTALENHFQYLNAFNGDVRFAPDEPSSYSSIEYTFNNLSDSTSSPILISVGLFRNHIKGDMYIGNEKIHWGRGNSNFGIVGSIEKFLSPFNNTLSFSILGQLSGGPIATRFESINFNEERKWGVQGYGISSNIGLNAYTPVYKFLRLGVGVLYNVSYTSLTNVYGNTEKNSFISINKTPAINTQFLFRF